MLTQAIFPRYVLKALKKSPHRRKHEKHSFSTFFRRFLTPFTSIYTEFPTHFHKFYTPPVITQILHPFYTQPLHPFYTQQFPKIFCLHFAPSGFPPSGWKWFRPGIHYTHLTSIFHPFTLILHPFS